METFWKRTELFLMVGLTSPRRSAYVTCNSRPGKSREWRDCAMTRFHAHSLKLTIGCLGLLGFLAALLVVGTEPASLSAAPAPQGTRVSCSSDDMRLHSCAADTRGGVRMVRQRSDAKCILNRTWGFDSRSIWVDRGCRAEFEVGAAPASIAFGETYTVYCASDDMQRAWCPADARFGVQLTRQRSEAACIQNQTWGYGKRGIWVDRGCRGDFQVSGEWQQRAAAMLYCASDDMMRNFCNINTRDGVFIIRQRSEADCVFNRTWGYDRNSIWVDRGCRADFEVVDYRQREWRDWNARRDDNDYRGYDRRDRDRDYRDRDDRPPYPR